MLNFLQRILKSSSLSLMSLVFSGLIILGGIYFYMALRLPDVMQLKEKAIQNPLKIFTVNGKLIGEFGEKKRIPVTLNQIPKQLIEAILDTEDQRYYEHKGVDFFSLLRAARVVMSSGKKSQGASTITMQVARNFFLNREKTYTRKLNEILLALKIDNTFSKEEILELYLNNIYLGQRAYGVAAAAQIYYGKSLNELTLPQIATLAGLPQAPSRENPIVNPNAAKERRNHVLERMLNNNHIDIAMYNSAVASPITTSYHETITEVQAPYVAEMVRQALVAQFGEAIYESGAKVYTTIDSRLQDITNQSLRNGILSYDKRHGYRGSEGHISLSSNKSWIKQLRNIETVNGLYPAAIVKVNEHQIEALLGTGITITISTEGFDWIGEAPTNILSKGSIIRVQLNAQNIWELTQLPKIEGALVALNPNDGAILALSGGFAYGKSNFNRVMQAERQAGSAFKPFIYSAAFAKGYTLASVINDAPVVLMDPATNNLWRPQNDSEQFYGPTRLRIGLIESRNVVSIRLLQAIGIPYTVDYLTKFGFAANRLPATPSLALGTANVTPLNMATGFAVFANGGYKVEPYFLSKITDPSGNKILFQATPAVAADKVPDNVAKNTPLAPHIITAQNSYLMTNVLQDVIMRGTGKIASALNRKDLAGKTGTTNDLVDGWFCGYNSDLVAVTWVGFDQPQTLYEHGAQTALPIWTDFIGKALAGKPEHTMAVPPGITTTRIDPYSGFLATPEQRDAIFEIFTNETVPTTYASAHEQASALINSNPSGAQADTSDDEPLF
jgi:penicillin-binding protein 1A